MEKNGLEKMMDLIRRQKWEKLFAKRDLVFKTECREFYKNLKEEWEPARYSNPLEITRKFANDDTILEARRAKSVEMKPFHRFLQIFVMKNLVPRFEKRDITSFMDLTYMDYLLSRRKIDSARVIIRHMTYVINVPNHELPYGELLTRILKPSFSLRENGVWWLGSGENRRRDDEEVAPTEAVNEEEQNQEFEWEAKVNEAADQGESGSDDKFYDAQVDVEEPVAEAPVVPAFPASPGDLTTQQKEPEAARVDPSGPSGHIPDSVLSKLQADFERARANRIQVDLEKAQDENARFLALLQQAQSKPKP
ncbi:hypothetical protein Dimus_001871 [Dionaea muscipula]